MMSLFRYVHSNAQNCEHDFNVSICFDRLGDTFLTWQRSHFGKDLKCIPNINHHNNNNHHHYRLHLENSQGLIPASCERQTSQTART